MLGQSEQIRQLIVNLSREFINGAAPTCGV